MSSTPRRCCPRITRASVAGVLAGLLAAAIATGPSLAQTTESAMTYATAERDTWITEPTSGVALYTRILEPAPALDPGRRFPAVIVVPGGLGDGAPLAGGIEYRELARRGFVVVAFNAPGRGNGFPGNLTSGGTEDCNGFAGQDALVAIIHYTAALPNVDAGNLGVQSGSYGITMAAGALGRHPELPVKYLVDLEGPSNNLITTFYYGPDERPLCDHRSTVTDPSAANLAWWQEREAYRFIGGFRGAYLRVQAEIDHAQPPGIYDHTLEMNNTAVSSGVPWVRVNGPEVGNPINVVYAGTLPAWLSGRLADHPGLAAEYVTFMAALGVADEWVDSPFGFHPAGIFVPGYPANGFVDAEQISVRWHRPPVYAFWFLVQGDRNDPAYDWTLLDDQYAAVPPSIRILANIAPENPRTPHGYTQPDSFIPIDEDAYVAFVEAAVERYDGDGLGDMPGLVNPIRHWQVGNEPNDQLTSDFATLQRITYQAIKRSCAECTVLIGGVAGFPDDYVAHFDSDYAPILAELAGEYVDVFDFHWYGTAAGEYRLRDPVSGGDVYDHVRSTLAAHGFSPQLPIWITEMGSYSGDPVGAAFPPQTERQQAADYFKRFIYSLARGVEKVFPAFGLIEGFKQDGGYFDHTGLIFDGRGPGDPGLGVRKLGYYTYRKMTEMLEGADWTTLTMLLDGTGGDYVFLFRVMKDGAPIHIAWWDDFDFPGDVDTMPLTLTGLSGSAVRVTSLVPSAQFGGEVDDYVTAFSVSSQAVSEGTAVIVLGQAPVIIEEQSAILRLNENRFAVEVSWSDPYGDDSGIGWPVPLTDDTGYFWFFDPANVELVVKVLDGRPWNGNFWVFYGALSDVEYWITVTDAETGAQKTYYNPPRELASGADTAAFAAAGASRHRAGTSFDLSPIAAEVSAGKASACLGGPRNLCLNGGRFRVEVSWDDPYNGGSGSGQAVPLTSDTGYFWFFDPANVELVVKVLDGTALNGYFWVFYGALSTVEYTITVTDTATGATSTYYNPPYELASRADTRAFSEDRCASP